MATRAGTWTRPVWRELTSKVGGLIQPLHRNFALGSSVGLRNDRRKLNALGASAIHCITVADLCCEGLTLSVFQHLCHKRNLKYGTHATYARIGQNRSFDFFTEKLFFRSQNFAVRATSITINRIREFLLDLAPYSKQVKIDMTKRWETIKAVPHENS